MLRATPGPPFLARKIVLILSSDCSYSSSRSLVLSVEASSTKINSKSWWDWFRTESIVAERKDSEL